MHKPRGIASVWLCGLFLVGCAAPQATRQQGAEPDINKRFKGEVNVDEWVDIFEGESRELYKRRHEIVDAMGLKPGMAVADVGAGTGFFSILFARRVGPTGKVYAVDIAPDFLKHIDQEARKNGLRNITTVHCTDDSVELPPESIDLAFICDVYHHFEYPRQSMRSIRRALRPGGEVVVIDFIRVEGRSRDWVIKHVRAGREEVTREIIADGFEPVTDGPRPPALEENYIIRFRKPE